MYVESVGMSKVLGPVNLENSEDEFSFVSNKSNETVREIDLEIRKILSEEYEKTLNTLKENRDKLDGVAGLLLKKETITGDEVRKIISGVTIEDILKKEKKENDESSENSENMKNENQKGENISEETDQNMGNDKQNNAMSSSSNIENNIENISEQSVETSENYNTEINNEKELVLESKNNHLDKENDKNDVTETEHLPEMDSEISEKKEEKKIEIPDFMK